MKNSEKRKSFKCETCKKDFKLKSRLTRHVSSVHDEKKSFKCEICDYSCSRKDRMKSHVESVHGEYVETIQM